MRRSLAALTLTALAAFPAMTAAEPAAPEAKAPAAVTGSATYLARIAAPEDAVFEAVLADVARADAPAVTLGRVVLRGAGNPPYAFSIPYDPEAVPPQAVLAVRATLAAGGRFLFGSDTLHRVEPGSGDVGEIVMVAVNAPLALVGTKWVLSQMGERTFDAADFAVEPPNLTFDESGRAFGSGGCNRIAAGYAAGAAGALFIESGAMTMMACPDPAMEIEGGFMAMLKAVDRWRIEDRRLVLEAAGAPLALLEAAP